MPHSKFTNSPTRFGWVTIVLHWLIALTVIGQFAVGLYMVDLNYHDPLYHQLPDIHKGVGSLLFFVLVCRIIWSMVNVHPIAEENVRPWEFIAARFIQISMNFLLLVIVIFGYLLSTAEGDAIDVFGLFEIPATITGIKNQEDFAGYWHYWIAMLVIGLASIHALAALKHHFIDKDATLLKMLGKSRS